VKKGKYLGKFSKKISKQKFIRTEKVFEKTYVEKRGNVLKKCLERISKKN
jgi:hypothetical protein